MNQFQAPVMPAYGGQTAPVVQKQPVAPVMRPYQPPMQPGFVHQHPMSQGNGMGAGITPLLMGLRQKY